MVHYIYTLTDPRTKMVRYVGKTNRPSIRLAMHLCEKRGTHKNNWIHQLKAIGLRPVMDVIEECDCGTWADRERFWIAHFRSVGVPLTNLDSGGRSGKLLSEETKAKISASNKGRKLPPEAIAKMKATKKANMTPDLRRRLGLAQLGVKQSDATKLKRSESLKGHPTSEETKRKIGLANSQKRASEETRAKIRAARANQVITEETKLKLSLVAKGRKPSPQCVAASAAASKGKIVSQETRAKQRASRLAYFERKKLQFTLN